MLEFLLIISIWENGRILKPYGLNSLEKCNMKFTFLCIVIVISCNVCASEDLHFYPGLRLARRSLINRRFIDSSQDELPPPLTFNIPYNHKQWEWNQKSNAEEADFPSDEEYDDKNYVNSIARRLQKLKNYLELKNQNLLRNSNDDDDNEELPIFNLNNARTVQYQPDNEYQNLDKFRQISDPYNNNFEKIPILGNVRPYLNAAEEDEGFTFGDDIVESNNDGFNREEIEKLPAKKVFNQHQMEESSSHHMNHKMTTTEKMNTISVNKKLFENAKIVDDPTSFAYPPSDPRFFEHTTIKQTTPPISNEKEESDFNYDWSKNSKTTSNVFNDIRLEHRSEDSRTEKGKVSEMQQDNVKSVSVSQSHDTTTVYIIAIVAGISAAATVGLIAVGIGWYNLQKHVKNASDVEYPAYGVTGPNKDVSPSGDRRLAQSAQMYHYQHQKQQIIAMENRAAVGERHGSMSEVDSEEENEEGDYTVYECPGLAPTGEMEVKNPMFQDDPTPSQTPSTNKSSSTKPDEK